MKYEDLKELGLTDKQAHIIVSEVNQTVTENRKMKTLEKEIADLKKRNQTLERTRAVNGQFAKDSTSDNRSSNSKGINMTDELTLRQKREEIMSIKNTDERQRMISKNAHLFKQ